MPQEYNNQIFWALGKVVDFPKKSTHTQKFQFEVWAKSFDKKQLINQNTPKQTLHKFRLSLYNLDYKLTVGDIILVKLKVKKKHTILNEGTFNYVRYLNANKINGTGYVVGKSIQKIETQKNSILQSIRNQFNEKVLALAQKHSIDVDIYALILALSNGNKSYLETQLKNIFNLTGTGHILAISGLHIGLIFVLMLFIFQSLNWVLIKISSTVKVNENLNYTLSFLVCLLYAVFSGFYLPAQRAILMLLIYLIFKISNKKNYSYWVMLSSMLIILIYDPFQALSGSFYLSYYFVFFLIYFGYGFFSKIESKSLLHKIKQIVILQLKLYLVGIPIVLVFFHQVNFVSPLVNLIIIPLFTFVFLPLLLILIFSFLLKLDFIFENIFVVCSKFFEWVIDFIMTPIYNLNFHIQDIYLSDLSVLILFFSLAVLLFSSYIPIKLIAISLLSLLLIKPNSSIKKGSFEVSILDVGQGLSLLVKTQNKTLVFDLGVYIKNRYNATELFVKPYLKYWQINTIDMLVLSSKDADHKGDIDMIINNFKVKNILKAQQINLAHFTHFQNCQQGIKWVWDNVKFEIIHPSKELLANTNNQSCVLLVSNSFHSLLISADIEKQAEQQILKNYSNLTTSVLLVPHHGSKTSSTEEFIQQLKPQIALVSTGYKNRYKHPYSEVVQRYKDNHIQILNTAQTGQIDLKFTQNIEIKTAKHHFSPFWQQD